MSEEKNMQEIIAELDYVADTFEECLDLMGKIQDIPGELAATKEEVLKKTAERMHAFEAEETAKASLKKPCTPNGLLTAPPVACGKIEGCPRPAMDILVSALIPVFLLLSFVAVVISYGSMYDNVYWFFTGIIFITFLVLWFRKGAPTFTALTQWQKKKKEYEENLTLWQASIDKLNVASAVDSITADAKAYDEGFYALVASCDAYFEKEFAVHMKELEKTNEAYEKKETELRNALEEKKLALSNCTVIHVDLLRDARRISKILKMGRASTLADAINLAIDDKRKEEETRILEEQAEDNRRHNEAMARAAEEAERENRRHQERMEREAQKQADAAAAQAREAQKQTEFAQKQASEARSAAMARCARCVNNTKCSYAQKSAPSCGAYTPR